MFGTRAPYRGFVSVEEHDLSFPKFDGTHSKSVTRTALVPSDAAIVMPYDPITDRVLLVEQFAPVLMCAVTASHGASSRLLA